MSQKFTLGQKLRYAFDNSISKGTPSLIGWLTLATFGLITAFSLPVYLGNMAPPNDGGASKDFGDVLWMALMRTLDAGTMGGDTGHWGFLFLMLAITLSGIFVLSMLIGILNSGLENKLDELRKGRSQVIESEHTVILGWSPQIFSVLSELIQANESRKRPCIAILGQKDKIEMMDEIRDRIDDFKNTRIVCRSGSPIDLNDLDMISVQTSRSVVVLSPGGEDADTNVIKSVLALTNGPNRRKEPYHIVAEISDPKNMEVAKMVGKDEVEIILSSELISRITVQACRQSGLSVVFTELLDFGGDEIYFKEEPAFIGKTFGESLLAYEDCCVLGLRLAQGGVRVNPPMETQIGPGDKMIVIAADDDKIKIPAQPKFSFEPDAILMPPGAEPAPERILILGWNRRIPSMVSQLDDYVAAGSDLTVVADFPAGEEVLKDRCPELKNQNLRYVMGDTTDRRVIDKLDVPSYHHVILLCSDDLPTEKADAQVLVTLLHLRDISDRGGYHFSIVSEMLDIRNRTLAAVTRPDDFIVSEKIVSLMLSQISENKELNAVFTDLFDPDGSEIYFRPASDYIVAGRSVSFATVVEAARQRGHLAIGYRIAALSKDEGKAYGVVVNPDKSEKLNFTPEDKVLILAED